MGRELVEMRQRGPAAGNSVREESVSFACCDSALGTETAAQNHTTCVEICMPMHNLRRLKRYFRNVLKIFLRDLERNDCYLHFIGDV